MSFKIPHSDLTTDEKRECMEIMRKGNDLMKAWALDYYGKENCTSRLRRGLFKWIANPLDDDAISPEQVGIPPSVMEAIVKVRTIESKMLFSHVKMVVGLARKFSWAISMTYLDFDDLLLEGFIAIRDAIYTFSNDKAEFITYAHHAVRHKFFREINKANDFGGFTKRGFVLLEKYHAVRKSLENELDSKVQIDTVLFKMNLDENDRKHLRNMLRRCVRASSLATSDGDGKNRDVYENLGTCDQGNEIDLGVLVRFMNRDGIPVEKQSLVIAAVDGSVPVENVSAMATCNKGNRRYKERGELVLEATVRGEKFWQAVKQAPLSDMERDLVVAAARGETDFQSRIALSYINPDTKQSYSRMTATNMLRRACKIVKEELRRAA